MESSSSVSFGWNSSDIVEEPYKIVMAIPVPSSPSPPWIELPKDLTANILQRLGSIELLESAQYVCSTWRNVCKDPAMWRAIYIRNSWDFWSIYRNPSESLEEICRQAVDRSQGQLIDIKIVSFGTDQLLEYIAERSIQLKCLKIVNCYKISGKGLIEAVKNFPHLEELYLTSMSSSISCEDIENIGLYCPVLKSFTFGDRLYMFSGETNEYSLAIAKVMPNLHHLQLGIKMTDEGLQAILDGCLQLESLDLRACYSLNVDGGLLTMLSRRVKDLRLPEAPVHDFEVEAGDQDYDAYDDSIGGCRDIDFTSDYNSD